jgi:hypothetical protein
MIKSTIYDALTDLSEKYIPEGKHPLLHINSREKWKQLMSDLIERNSIPKKVSFLTKCAINWEALLSQRQSILN